ncbi:MAG: 3-keto-disaccharide hydrolase [Planctomycetota bacterium]
MAKLGYDDTCFISGCKWRVHDDARPQPRVVTPATASTQETVGDAPSDAVMLFDGSDLSGWEKVGGGEPGWKVENGYMEVVSQTGDIQTRTQLGDCQIHLEWAAPTEITGDSQQRGNSGVFLMGRYELQVLDCYDNDSYADGMTGAIYGQCPPLVNACRAPGQWQTYDIIWTAPRFEGDKLLRPARVTLLHNGVLLHHDKELLGPTNHKVTTHYEPHPGEGPLRLQDHRDAVRYRNIWYRPLRDYDEA